MQRLDEVRFLHAHDMDKSFFVDFGRQLKCESCDVVDGLAYGSPRHTMLNDSRT